MRKERGQISLRSGNRDIISRRYLRQSIFGEQRMGREEPATHVSRIPECPAVDEAVLVAVESLLEVSLTAEAISSWCL
jgi:hypothetical protein